MDKELVTDNTFSIPEVHKVFDNIINNPPKLEVYNPNKTPIVNNINHFYNYVNLGYQINENMDKNCKQITFEGDILDKFKLITKIKQFSIYPF